MSTLKQIAKNTLIELERLNAEFSNKAINQEDIQDEWDYQDRFDQLEQSLMRRLKDIHNIESPTYKQLIEPLLWINSDLSAYSSLIHRLDDLLKQYIKYVRKKGRR